MANIEIERLQEEKELNLARTEYLSALAESKGDNALVEVMPGEPAARGLPIALIGLAALLIWGKIL